MKKTIMTNWAIKSLAFLLAFGAGATAFAADTNVVVDTACIFEIRPCKADGTSIQHPMVDWPTDAPLDASQPLYFNVRLIVPDGNKGPYATRNEFSVYYSCNYDPDVFPKEYQRQMLFDSIFNPLKLGIYVNGALDYAEFVTLQPTKDKSGTECYDLYDLVFKYEPKVGDFALPIRLAVRDNYGNIVPAPENFDTESIAPTTSYVFQNDNKWSIRYTVSQEGREHAARDYKANMTFINLPATESYYDDSPDKGDEMNGNYSLKQCGFYVKTVDFEDNVDKSEWEDPTYWKSVKKGGTSTFYLNTKDLAPVVTNMTSSLFVWSDDEEVMKISGGVQKSVIVGYTGGGTTPIYKKINMAEVKFQTGASVSGGFKVQGVESNKVANLILSGFDSYAFNISGLGGVMITNFVTVPVSVAAPAPCSLTLSRISDVKTYTVSNDYETALTQLKLVLSEAYTNEMKVTVAPVLNNPGDYLTNQIVRINNENQDSGWVNDGPLTVTFDAGEKEKKIDVYGMGADKNHTVGTGNEITFKIVDIQPAAAKAFVKSQTDAAAFLYFKPVPPVVSTPAEGDTFIFVGEQAYEIDFTLTDTYFNTQDTDTGYTIYWDYNGDGQTYVALSNNVGEAALWRPDSDGILRQFKDGAMTDARPSVTYVDEPTTGTSKFRVVAPNGEKTALCTVNITYKEPAEPPTMSAVALNIDADNPYVEENTNISVRVELSEMYHKTKTVYAFLRPTDTNLFAKLKNNNNMAIAGARSYMQITGGSLVSKTGTFVIDDGSEAGQDFNFEVVLCTSQIYSPANTNNLVKKFANADPLYVCAFNIRPTVQGVRMNTLYKTVWDEDLDAYRITQPVPPDIPVTFDVKKLFTEPSSKDLAATETDPDRRFYTKFFFEEDMSETNMIGNASTASITHKFSSASGMTRVIVSMRDKDMNDTETGGDGEFGEEFEFYIEHSSKPTVSIGGDRTWFSEDTSYYSSDSRTITIAFSTRPTVQQNLRLTVTSSDEESNNPGAFELKTGSDVVAKGGGVYEVAIPAGTLEKDIEIAKLDGTVASADGFVVSVEVITAGQDPSTKTPWSEYYQTVPCTFRVSNAAPHLMVPSLDMNGEYLQGTCGAQNTNAYVVGASVLATPIKWRVSDIDLDLNTNDSAQASVRTNLTVTWSVGGIEQLTTNVTSKTQIYTFAPDFTGMAGEKSVTVSVSDKDEGLTTASWLYQIQSSKMATTKAHGPGGGSSLALSSRYKGAGLGQGHVWADQTFSLASKFAITWNCGLNKTVGCYAWGYKAGCGPDDGSLNGGDDVAIDASGNNATGKAKPGTLTCYQYNSELDSYFYRWISIVSPEDVESEDLFTSFTPESADATVAALELPLPSEEDEEGGYPATTVEAIFSKEYLATDNMGDINYDMIPDLYVANYRFDVLDSNSAITGDDMASLTTYNADLDADGNAASDYLPIFDSAKYAGFVPALSNTWVTEGSAFTAKLEIRGWGDGLNDAPLLAGVVQSDKLPDIQRCYEDPATNVNSTLTALEWWAYTNYCARANLDYTVTNNWAKWSPERPTDPTLADTDADGLTDGYEYYIWYRAYVGYQETDGSYRQIEGRRYNPIHPLEPEVITSEQIAALYDPLTAFGSDYLTADTDNDGLPDYIEFMIGTKPFDYDTDYDGLPDGYEVYVSETNPQLYASDSVTCDGALNTDGDAMAYYQFVKKSETEDLRWYVAKVSGGYLCSPEEITLVESPDEPGVTNRLAFANPDKVYTAFRYYTSLGASVWTGAVVSAELVLSNEYCRGHILYCSNSWNNLAVTGPVTREIMNYLHYQVYQELPYDARTAWGYAPNFAKAYNSRPFTHLDEFLVEAFYYHMNGLAETDLKATVDTAWSTLWVQHSPNPLKADTDDDGIPDGWELYVQAGAKIAKPETPTVATDTATVPANGPNASLSPRTVSTADNDNDQLDAVHEFAGVETCAFYPDCETIVDQFANLQPTWLNKRWPTNPWNADTDGDGVTDSVEGQNFIYGASTVTSPCVPGGGLNPLSWDTDQDGLPDSWELQFKGTFSTVTTTSSSSSNTTSTVTWNMDGMDGTDNDARLDYDGDGLANWQEYMVGTMRCWRYDDPNSGWLANKMSTSDIPSEPGTDEWNDFWYGVLVDEQNAAGMFNPNFANGIIDPAGAYMSCCTNEYDAVKGMFYYFADGVYHDLKDPSKRYYDEDLKIQFNRYTWKPAHAYMIPPYAVQGLTYPKQYICCNPTRYDTDYDGMDDFYELFHGLNPILGASGVIDQHGLGLDTAFDLIYTAYLCDYNGEPPTTIESYPPSAENNWWWNSMESHRAGTYKYGAGYDFLAHPWLNGMAVVDPDGDNIRNQQEAILPNVQAAATYTHTDPTPLWVTDTTYSNSLTRLCYRLSTLNGADENCSIWDIDCEDDSFTHDGVTYHIADFPGFTLTKGENPKLSFEFDINNWGIRNDSAVNGWMFSFEENEGYDSDHDFISDFEEAQNGTEEQDHDDTIRRQPMYFNGTDAFLQTPVAEGEQVPMDHAASEARQNFLYFTVECWAKPDTASLAADDTVRTLVERAIYTDYSGPADENLLRKNFLIGLRNGRWYAKFDSTGTDAKQPVEITDGPSASNGWTHVAATYDGTALRLYVNGICNNSQATSAQPEHGVSYLAVNDQGEINPEGGTKEYTSYVSILVGASARTYRGTVFDWAWRYRNYSNADDTNPEGLVSPEKATSLADYTGFYKGYIDEVRIWDGARAASDILSDVENRTRYTEALVEENRQDVYALWKEGARRSEAGNGNLPAQLMYHWAFDHLAGAILPEDLIKVPAGFDTDWNVTDAKARWVRPADWTERRWAASAVRSTVYTDTTWVPWVNNTVSHAARFDQTTLDSVYWSGNYAGEVLGTYGFPRNNEVYSRWRQMTYSQEKYHDRHFGETAQTYGYAEDTRWHVVTDYEAMNYTTNDLAFAFRFARRDRQLVGDDLLPMGGAYPKRIGLDEGGMWDNPVGTDPTAADAWAQTGNDASNSGLPDWWKEYARQNYCEDLPPEAILTRDTMVTYDGRSMTAWEAYQRDLAKGMVKKGETIGYLTYVNEEGKTVNSYEMTNDSAGDGIPDWWKKMYGVTGSAEDDPDNDGLSTYAEYLLGEVYPTAYDLTGKYGVDKSKIVLDPMNAYSSTGQKVPDYYLAYSDKFADVTNSPSHFYLNEFYGEIETDHDFMEDWWENLYDVSYTSAAKHDPLADNDEDGWSTWAECRASLWGNSFTASLIDKWTGSDSSQYVACRPQPIVGVKVTYYGTQDINGQQLIVRTTSGQTKRTDATFVVPATLDGQTKFIGGFDGDTVLHGHMSPGMLNANSIVFDKARVTDDKVYTWNCDWYKENTPNDWGWDEDPWDTDGDYYLWSKCSRTHTGDFATYKSEFQRWPKIELEGGDFQWESFLETVPSTDLSWATLLVNGVTTMGWVDCTTGEYELDMTKLSDVESTVFRVTYTSRVGNAWPQTVYLSDTKELETTGIVGIGEGYVREGSNTIEAFIDLDADGQYTAGEPYGVVQNVEVGWHKTPVTLIELKDTSHIVPRYDVSDNSNDRAVVDGATASAGEASVSGLNCKLRIRRVSINGATELTAADGTKTTVPKRVMATTELVLDSRSYLTETDILKDNILDLDWFQLTNDWVRLTHDPNYLTNDLRTVGYTIEQVVTDVDGSSSNVVLATFENRFNTYRGRASLASPINETPVYSCSPTFAFSCDDETMTAYRLQIRKAGDRTLTNLVYDSGCVRLPGRTSASVGSSVYEVTPAIYAGAPVGAGVTTNHAVFADGESYEWRVALYNAKFRSEEESVWSATTNVAWSTFQMDIANNNRYPKIPTGYGNVSLAVRYYGPTNFMDETDAKKRPAIYAEAFENADFCGQPLARACVAISDTLRSRTDISLTNVVLRGISPGTRFIRAFVDFNGNGVRDDWESWGYVNNVGRGVKAIYNPIDITVESSSKNLNLTKDAQYVLYMEDCDVDQNEIPDCLQDPAPYPTLIDTDGDGLTDEDEKNIYHTDPYNPDTDGDGLTDYEEVELYDTDPTDADSDKDGLSDGTEIELGTDPTKNGFDTDGDGMDDGWEVRNGTDPTNDDADTVMTGDVMAYATIGARLITFEGETYALLPANEEKGVTARLYRTFNVGGKIYVGAATDLIVEEGEAGTVSDSVVLMHSAVYDWFGYNTETARNDSTNAPNTAAFTWYHKYLTDKHYLPQFGIETEPVMAKLTDSSNNQIPDGWELYVAVARVAPAPSFPVSDGELIRHAYEHNYDPYDEYAIFKNLKATDPETAGALVPFTNDQALRMGFDEAGSNYWSYATTRDVMAIVENVPLYVANIEDRLYAVKTFADKVQSTNVLYTTFALDNGQLVVGALAMTDDVDGLRPLTVADVNVADGHLVETNVTLIHGAVYDFYGFDATTAQPVANAANTAPFTRAWKLVTNLAYLPEFGLDTEPLNLNAIDSNANAIHDGWELYVSFAAISPVQSFPVSNQDEIKGAFDYAYDPWTTVDGVPNLWKLQNFINPCSNANDIAIAGDYMAYAEEPMQLVWLSDGTFALVDKAARVVVGDLATNLAETVGLTLPWAYGDDAKFGTEDYTGKYGYTTNAWIGSEAAVVTKVESVDAVLIHDQVYARYGFDATTATQEDGAYTKPFTAFDKYIIVRYLESLGLADEDAARMFSQWDDVTLDPNTADTDADGIPDGWELYVGADPWNFADRESDADNDGARLVDEYNNGEPLDPNNAHTISAEMLDGDVSKYQLQTAESQLADEDNDGLSNMQEYTAAKNGLVPNATNLLITSNISDGMVLDYFRTNGLAGVKRRYLGELVADHDFMEDAWEVLYGASSRAIYDSFKDADNDGWSNWSEARAGTNPSRAATLGLVNASGEDNTQSQYPTPTVQLKITCPDSSAAQNATVVVQAWKGQTAVGQADATWSVSGASDAAVVCSRYIGYNPNKTVHLNLGPGAVAQMSLGIYFFDPSQHTRVDMWDTNHTYIVTSQTTWCDIDTADWHMQLGFHDIPDGPESDTGSFLGGTINYVTGEVSIDFTQWQFVDTTGVNTLEESSTTYYDLANSFVKIQWRSRIVENGNNKTVYLSAPESGNGALREGVNTFFAFADLNGNGAWDEGEPFGYKKGVEVGYDKVSDLAIELTDAAPTLKRVALTGISSNAVLTVRRTAINETATADEPIVWTGTVPARGYLTEADFLTSFNGYVFDSQLLAAATAMGVATQTLYRADYALYADGVLVSAMTNTFTATRALATPVAPSAKVDYRQRTAQATFTFQADETAYSAFRIEVADAATNVVWTSPVSVLPAATTDGNVYKAPLYVGPTQVLKDGSNYFWRVAQFNGKFAKAETDADWSAWTPFATAVDSSNGDTGYGALAAEIRYYGAATNAQSRVIVGVYETADFTGDPIAKATLGGDESVQELARRVEPGEDYMKPATNVVLDGVATGAKYVMAFIDVNGNGTRENYEPWGYLNNVGTDTSALYTPMTLVVSSAKADTPTGIIFIEDTDVNDNGAPDCIEDTTDWDEEILPSDADLTDPDGDGLTTYEELYRYGTNPYAKDSDGDGMPDGWEVANDLNPRANDADVCGTDDVMALKALSLTAYVATNGTTNVTYLVREMKDDADHANQVTNFVLYTTFENPLVKDGPLYVGRALTPAEQAAVTNCQIGSYVATNVVAMHSAVYDFCGYDASAAQVGGSNTVAFTAYYKYLTQKYYLAEVDPANDAKFNLTVGNLDSNNNGLDDGCELYVRYVADDAKENDIPFDVDRARSASGDNKLGLVYDMYDWLVRDEDGNPIDNLVAIEYRLVAAESDESGVNGLNADYDMDGLSNYQEYKALADLGLVLDVEDPMTDGTTPDYFRVGTGNVYAGEKYNGAEWIDAETRATLTGTETTADGRTFPIAASDLVRAGTRDINANGWDLWSESQNAVTNDISYRWIVTNCNADAWAYLAQRAINGEIVFRDGFYWNTALNKDSTAIVYYRELSGNNADYTPLPEYTVTFRGPETLEDQATRSVVVKAYQIASQYPEKGEQCVAKWTVAPNFKSCVASVTLDANHLNWGRLNQGFTRFYAYLLEEEEDGLETDVDSVEPSYYGYAEVNVGFSGGNLEIELGTPNYRGLPLINLTPDVTWDGVTTDDAEPVQSVAIVRTAVNGVQLDKPRGVYTAYFRDNIARQNLYPSDFVRRNFVGVDRFLAADFDEDELGRIYSVEYAIIDGKDRPYDIDDWQTNLITTIKMVYSETRDKATINAISDALDSTASISFKIPKDTVNSKFWLKVNGKVFGGVTGYAIPYTASGLFTCFLKDHPEIDNIVTGRGNTFQVALGNDKYGYPAADDFCDEVMQTIAADANRASGYQVTVKHPTAVAADFAAGTMVVAAYATADLAEPVAWTNVTAFDGAAIPLRGLRADKEYFVAAWYVKNPNDGRGASRLRYRQPYDSWGYLSQLGSNATCFAAMPLEATAKNGQPATAVTVWLQDTDFNDNDDATTLPRKIDRFEDLTAVYPSDDAEASMPGPEDDFDDDDVPDPLDPDPVFPDDDDDPEDDDGYDRATAGDLMAYLDVDVQFVALGTDDVEANWTWYALMDTAAEVDEIKATDGLVYKGTRPSQLQSAAEIYDYGAYLTGVGRRVTFATTDARTVRAAEYGSVRLVHAQVFAKCGFNTKTASRTAYLEGEGVNTKLFTRADKFLVPRYLHAIGVEGIDPTNYFGTVLEYETVPPYSVKIRTDKPEWSLYLNDQTGVAFADADGDDVADGWELYTMFGVENAPVGDTVTSALESFMTSPFTGAAASVTYLTHTLASLKVSPFNYADGLATSPGDVGLENTYSKLGESVALTLQEEYDHGYWPTDPWRRDTDSDNVIDYYAYRYHLKGDDAGEDWDDDLLSNYAEYLVTEVFQFAVCDPDDSKTNDSTQDYFRKVGDLYIGELFTDHDQVNDEWEGSYADYANRYVYDPSRDEDGDGWSNYAEYRAGTRPDAVASPGVDGYVMPEYPIPVIEANVIYSGKQQLSGNLVFQCWGTNDCEMTGQPDAQWVSTTADNATNVTKYVGQNPGKEVTYSLGVGAVSPGSVKVYFLDTCYEKACIRDGVEEYSFRGEVGDAQWYNFIQDYNGELYTAAMTNSVLAGVSVQSKVGTIDYATGTITIDFSSPALQQAIYQSRVNGSGGSVDPDSNNTGVYYSHEKVDLSRSYVKLSWKSVMLTAYGNASYLLADPTGGKGHVREGTQKFVVFCDIDGSNAYTPGEPFGFARDVSVGWQGGSFSVQLTETTPVFARIDLRATDFEACADRQVWQEGRSTVLDISADKYSELRSALGVTCKNGDSELDLSSTRLTRVRVMRVMVNESAILGYDASKNEIPIREVILDKYLDLGTRSYLHEGDFLTAGKFDADWGTMTKSVCEVNSVVSKNETCNESAYQDPTNVTYAIVMGEGDVSTTTSNLIFRCIVSKTFDYAGARMDESVATTIRPVIDTTTPQNIVYGAKPTFRFAMRDDTGVNYNSYTAFNLKINDTPIGLRPLPPADANGWYSWTLDDPIGVKFAESGNFKWSVALYNAKFQGGKFQKDTITEWSDEGTFIVNLNNQQPMNDHGYSSIAVAVRYAGPDEVLDSAKSRVIVQAFETADFAGVPAGQTAVETKSSCADIESSTANAIVKGIPATGTYYLRAFIDMNNNGVKDDFESWGASPDPVAISTETLVRPTASGIWIEDADTDGDWLPDAWEWATEGTLTFRSGKIIGSDQILFSATASTYTGSAGFSTGLSGASMTLFQNNSTFVKTLLGKSLSDTVSIDDIRAAVEKKVINPTSVKIAAITLAPDGSKVTLSVEAEVSPSIAGEVLGQLYSIATSADTTTVTVKVYKKTTLVEAWPTEPTCTATATIGRTAADVDVPISGVDMTSGFYKIEVVQ